MGQFSLAKLFGMTIRESANDGSDFTNPDADFRRLFLGEDGQLHVKDSAGTVTDIGLTAGVAGDAIWDTKGDLAAATGANAAVKVPAGANDTIFMADSAQTAGLKWVASQTPSTQAFGDSAAEGTADTYARGDHKHAMPDEVLDLSTAETDATLVLAPDGTGGVEFRAEAGGGGGGSATSGASVRHSGSISISTSPQIILWDTEDYDTDGYHSTVTATGRFTAPTDGFYAVSFIVEYNNIGGAVNIGLYKNGTAVGTNAITYLSSGAYLTNGAAVIYLVAGDYVQVVTVGSTGGSIVNTDVVGRFTIARTGGSSSLSPGWMQWFMGITDSTHFYWTGSDLAGFTAQTVSGSATWAENGNAIQVLATNQTADDAAVQLIAKTISIGDEWILAVNSTFPGSDVGGTGTGLRGIGIVMTDGTGTGANCVIGHLQMDNGGSGGSAIMVGRIGTLTSYNVGAPWVSQAVGQLFGGWVFVKLKYSAANTFQLFWGPTPYQFSAFGEADISKTMTPTHIGLFVSMVNPGTALGMFGPLKKV